MRKKATEPNAWRLYLDGKEGVVESVTELRQQLKLIAKNPIAEIQLIRGDLPEHNLFALVCDGRAVLSYSYNIDEASFSARENSSFDGNAKDIEFRFSNGECNWFPRSETISVKAAFRAFESFYRTVTLDPAITWLREF